MFHIHCQDAIITSFLDWLIWYLHVIIQCTRFKMDFLGFNLITVRPCNKSCTLAKSCAWNPGLFSKCIYMEKDLLSNNWKKTIMCIVAEMARSKLISWPVNWPWVTGCKKVGIFCGEEREHLLSEELRALKDSTCRPVSEIPAGTFGTVYVKISSWKLPLEQ